ncbi:MAG: hypothetical protein ACK559_20255, partial [bacterium]
MIEERVGRRATVHEAHMRDRPTVQRTLIIAFGERRDLGAIAVARRGERQKLEEGAAADRDLPVERIGHGQAPVQVDMQAQRMGP